MNDSDEKFAIANLVLDYIQAKNRYAQLEERGAYIATSLDKLSERLKRNPDDSEKLALLKECRGMDKLIEDLKAAHKDKRRLEDLMQQLGFNEIVQ